MSARATNVQPVAWSGFAQQARFLPFALGGFLIGLVLIILGARRSEIVGPLLLVVAGAWTLQILASLLLPQRPALALTPRGVSIRQLSPQTLAWQDVLGVEVTEHEVSHRGSKSTLKNVVAIRVTVPAYDAFAAAAPWHRRHFGWENQVSRWGDRAAIILFPQQLGVPHEELKVAIAARWEAFRDAPRTSVPPRPARPVVSAVSRRGAAAVTPAGAVLKGRPPLWAWPASAAMALCVAVALANLGGVWETTSQRERRLEREAWAAETREREAARKKQQEEWDAMFRDMDRRFNAPGEPRPPR